MCLDSPDRRRVIEDMCAGVDRSLSVQDEYQDAESDRIAMNLSLENTLREIIALLEGGPVANTYISSKSDQLRNLLVAVGTGQSFDWRGVLRLAEEIGIELSRWQTIVLGTWLSSPIDGQIDSAPPRT